MSSFWGASYPSLVEIRYRVYLIRLKKVELVLERELTTGDLRQTLECYALEPDKNLPALDDLLAMRDLLGATDISRGFAHELLGLIGRDIVQAQRRYKRWREVMRDHNRELLQKFDQCMSILVGPTGDEDLPFGALGKDRLRRSPLGDVNTLNAVGSL